jgi:hypothetical protein
LIDLLAKDNDRAIRTRTVLYAHKREHAPQRRALRALGELANFVVAENHG